MTNLEPCPFCGHKGIKIIYAELRFIGQNYIGHKKHIYKAYARCNKCLARGKPITFEWISGRADSKEKLHEHDIEAVEAWNGRANND